MSVNQRQTENARRGATCRPGPARRGGRRAVPLPGGAGGAPAPHPAPPEAPPIDFYPPLSPEQQRATGVTPELVRLSVGLEDVRDLIADLDQALGEASAATRSVANCAAPMADIPAHITYMNTANLAPRLRPRAWRSRRVADAAEVLAQARLELSPRALIALSVSVSEGSTTEWARTDVAARASPSASA